LKLRAKARYRTFALFDLGAAPVASAVAHSLRMLVGLVIIKMIAVVIGPSGFAILGNFMSVITMISVFAGGGIITGIGKYVSEYSQQPRRMIGIIGSAFCFGLIFSVIFMAISVIGAVQISHFLFNRTDYFWLVPCLGLAQLFCFFGAAIIAIVNGQHRYDLFAIITITGYVGCLPVAFLLIKTLGIPGAALGLAASISCAAVPALVLVLRSKITPLIRLRINLKDASALSKFSLMALASAVLYPSTEMLIRTQIINTLGLVDAGYWQAMARLSGAYLGFFTVFLATSLMPRLSAIPTRSGVVRLVNTTLSRVGFAFFVVALFIFLLRHLIITTLFSQAFLQMQHLFAWQLLGDFFRVCAYVIGTAGVSKAAVKLYIAAEVIQCLLYGLFSTIVIINGGSIENILQAYVTTYFIYFCITVIALQIYRRGG
jgi:O-antigen/teichoic acid export membrane protein